MHVINWLWHYLDTASRICIACCCTDFYGQVAELWKHVIIPQSIPINDDNLMPILICAQNIESLTINFPFDIEEEEASEALILNINNNNDETAKKKGYNNKPIKFPSNAINASYLPHLKHIKKIDFKSCGSNSYQSFILSFILELSKFITLKHLCIPQLFTIRHNCLEILDIHQLQIGFDGMNVHLGADLIGITHLKKQIPSIKQIFSDELYLFIGEDIYINHEKSGKQYWIIMRKWCNQTNINIIFRNTSITIMLMPRDKKTPPLIYEKWENIKDWLQDRIGNFIQNEIQNEIQN